MSRAKTVPSAAREAAYAKADVVCKAAYIQAANVYNNSFNVYNAARRKAANICLDAKMTADAKYFAATKRGNAK